MVCNTSKHKVLLRVVTEEKVKETSGAEQRKALGGVSFKGLNLRKYMDCRDN